MGEAQHYQLKASAFIRCDSTSGHYDIKIQIKLEERTNVTPFVVSHYSFLFVLVARSQAFFFFSKVVLSNSSPGFQMSKVSLRTLASFSPIFSPVPGPDHFHKNAFVCLLVY